MHLTQKGVAIYLAILIMTVLLAIALGLSSIFVGQIKTIKGVGDSVVAFYAADTGIERELKEENYLFGTGEYSDYLDLDGDGGGLAGAQVCPVDLIDSDDACYKVIIDSVSPYIIRSIGVFKKTQRAIEISF